MQKIKVSMVIVVSLMLVFLDYDNAKAASQKGSKATKVPVNFSFAGVDWKDTPEKVIEKISQTGLFDNEYELNSKEYDFSAQDSHLNDAFNLCHDEIPQEERKNYCGVSVYSFSGKDDVSIKFFFSDIAQKLLYYKYSFEENGRAILDMLIGKYGQPPITITYTPDAYQWKGNGQNLYFLGFQRDVIYTSTVNTDEFIAIVQKRINEIEQSKKNKMKGVF